MKIRPVRNELLLADRQADGQYDANSSFLQFCEGVWKVYRICLLFFYGCKVGACLRERKENYKIRSFV